MIITKKAFPMMMVLASLSLAACGSTYTERGVSGAATGALIGTGIGAIAGGTGTGAAIGAGVGLLGGVLTDESQIDLSDAFDSDKRVFGRDADE